MLKNISSLANKKYSDKPGIFFKLASTAQELKIGPASDGKIDSCETMVIFELSVFNHDGICPKAVTIKI